MCLFLFLCVCVCECVCACACVSCFGLIVFLMSTQTVVFFPQGGFPPGPPHREKWDGGRPRTAVGTSDGRPMALIFALCTEVCRVPSSDDDDDANDDKDDVDDDDSNCVTTRKHGHYILVIALSNGASQKIAKAKS